MGRANTRAGSGRATAKAAATPQAPEEQQSSADDFIEALAGRLLQQLGTRKPKAKQLSGALQTAAAGLEPGPARSYIEDHLEACAEALHQQLQAKQQAGEGGVPEPAPQPKRAKKTAKGRSTGAPPPPPQAAEEGAVEEGAAEVQADVASEAGYLQIVTAAMAGGSAAAGAAYPTPALLLARRPAHPALLAWHVQQQREAASNEEASPAQRVGALVAGAEAALALCSSLAAQAPTPEAGLATFDPAITLLCDAALLLPDPGGAAEEGSDLPQRIVALADRALACMQLSLQQAALRSSSSAEPAAGSSSFWRRWQPPSEGSAAAAVRAASATCAAVVSLLTTLRQRCAPGAAAGERALAAAAALDMSQLAPYAARGQLAYIAESAEWEGKGADSAHCLLALHAAAARQEVPADVEGYLLRMAAARRAAACASWLGQHTAAATTADAAARIPAPAEVVEWLQQQPPSAIVLAALASLRQGQAGLSTHLVQGCEEATPRTLLAAARGSGEGAADGGEGGGSQPTDDLLFFVSKEGDASMFGRVWGPEEEEEEEEGDGKGVQLQCLPGVGSDNDSE